MKTAARNSSTCTVAKAPGAGAAASGPRGGKKPVVSPEIRQHIATTLKQWMKQHPCLDTQEKLALAANVGQTTVSRILRGTTAATVGKLDALARALGRDVEELLSTDSGQRLRYDVKRFRLVSELVKERIETFIDRVIAENEARLAACLRAEDETLVDCTAAARCSSGKDE